MQHFDAYMNPATHQMQQTIYMASYNDKPTEKDDIFRILAQVPPQEVEDKDAPAPASSRRWRRRRATSSERAVDREVSVTRSRQRAGAGR